MMRLVRPVGGPTMPARFQQRRRKGWNKPPSSACVAARARYASPFQPARWDRGDPAAHADAVARFREWITAPERAELLARARRELRGCDLGCSCPLDLPCHADVWLELVKGD
jgi:hypothetical protein